MDKSTMLTMLKVDLGISTTTAYDERLTEYLNSAQDALIREGVRPNLSVNTDCSLVIMYAAWMWRKRDTSEAMPRMLRWQINNRLFSEKV